MALTVTHALISAIADDPVAAAAGEVVPSDWNADHTISVTSLTIATGTITMTITVTDDVMRVEVCSDSDGVPHQVASSDESPDGRGLLLIEKLASDWGHVRRDSTLCVWADVQCP